MKTTHHDREEVYTAVCWGAREDSSTGGVTENVGSGFVAFGCDSGHVQVWNPQSGERLSRADAFAAIIQGADCSVTALAPSQPHRSSVFAGCRGGTDVLEVGVFDGVTRTCFKADKVGVSHLAASPWGSEWIVSAGCGSTLRLWSVSGVVDGSASKPVRLAGPALPVTSVEVCSLEESALVLCCDGAAQVDLFRVASPAGAAQKGPLASSAVLSCHEQISTARFVRPTCGEHALEVSQTSRVRVVGYSISAVVVWSVRLDEESPKTVTPALSMSAAELQGKVLGVYFAERSSLLVASGPSPTPTFSRVALNVKKGSAAVEARVSSVVLGEKSKEKKGTKKPAPPTVMGPLDVVVPRNRQTGSKRPVEASEEVLEEDAKRQRADAKPGLSALSLAPMVRQGLIAKEDGAIERVVQTADRQTIQSTVKDLSGAEAYDLLQECTRRLVSQPIRGQVLASWIQSVLVVHGSFIMSRPVLRQGLEPMHDAFQARIYTHRALTRLRGHLRFLLDLGKHSLEDVAQERATVRTPLLEYVEQDEGQDASSDEADSEENDDESDVASDMDGLSDFSE